MPDYVAIDDSDSMKYDEGGVRIKTLQKILNNIADVYGLARENGIVTVRFINAPQGKKNVTPKTVRNVIKNHNYGGVTRIGTELKKKIIDKFVSENMEKPLLIMVITDGAVRPPKYYPFFLSALRNSLKFSFLRPRVKAKLF